MFCNRIRALIIVSATAHFQAALRPLFERLAAGCDNIWYSDRAPMAETMIKVKLKTRKQSQVELYVQAHRSLHLNSPTLSCTKLHWPGNWTDLPYFCTWRPTPIESGGVEYGPAVICPLQIM